MSKRQKIAYQGVPGAYSHLSCQAFCPEWEAVAYESFSNMLRAVQIGECDSAMVPVENSTAGRVADIHHMLPDSGLHIVAEHFQPVNHKLLAIKGATLSQIKEVHSHEQGLAQCRKKLQDLGIKPVIHSDTAGAASDVASWAEPSKGAIASSLAADIYGLDILIDEITDMTINTTRFLIMKKQMQTPDISSGPSHCTFVFSVRSVPAALYKALGGFATNGINLTKIESYMSGNQMRAAQFYVDCEGHIEHKNMQLALEELKFYCLPDAVKILGCYPSSPHRYAAK
ncbi:prephenate dehydratase [Alphaproteobacteria bacterium]|nr:prephenate dehydratase [Alphaproteobacteria bacterium]